MKKLYDSIQQDIEKLDAKRNRMIATRDWYNSLDDVASYHFSRGMISELNDSIERLYELKAAVRQVADEWGCF